MKDWLMARHCKRDVFPNLLSHGFVIVARDLYPKKITAAVVHVDPMRAVLT